jgi:hypothetical protein
MKPLNDLLKSDVQFYWGPAQERAYDQVKKMVTSAPTLAYFDVKLPTVVSADASSYGIGGAIFQRHGDQLKPVAFCSRLLTKCEQNYAQIEKECLASTWVCEKFSMYLTGLDTFTLYTDHKPLVPLMMNRDIDRCPLRVQRLLLRLMPFNFVAEHVPGKNLVVADTLSRVPIAEPDEETHRLVDEIEVYAEGKVTNLPVSEDKLQQMRTETHDDPNVMMAMRYMLHGWPRYFKNVPDDIRDYWRIRAQLSVVRGLLVYGDRIVVPTTMRTGVLAKLHQGHWGISKCRERAAEAVWWPGISSDIERVVKSCTFCQENMPAQRKEPLVPSDMPDGPWQRIGADLCKVGAQIYLVAIDYYSRYIEIAHIPSESTKSVVCKLKCMFARWGVPCALVIDKLIMGRALLQLNLLSSPGSMDLSTLPVALSIRKLMVRQKSW